MQQGEASMTLLVLQTDDAHRSNCLSNQLLYITEGFLLIWVSGPLLKRAPNLNIVQYLTKFNYKRL